MAEANILNKALRSGGRVMFSVPKEVQRHMRLKAGDTCLWVLTKTRAAVLVNVSELAEGFDQTIHTEGGRHEQAAAEVGR